MPRPHLAPAISPRTDAVPASIAQLEAYSRKRFERVDGGRAQLDYAGAVLPYIARPPRRALDVGMGPGHEVAMLASLAPGAALHGVDADPVALGQAQRTLRRRGVHATLAVGRGECLPYPDASFDLVLAHFVLPYVPARDVVLRELARVLAPGGVLWVLTHGFGYFTARLLRDRWRPKLGRLAAIGGGLVALATDRQVVPAVPVTATRLVRDLERAGLQVARLDWSTYGGMARSLSASAMHPGTAAARPHPSTPP